MKGMTRVDERQIDIIGPQLFQAFLQARDQAILTKIFCPDFSGDI